MSSQRLAWLGGLVLGIRGALPTVGVAFAPFAAPGVEPPAEAKRTPELALPGLDGVLIDRQGRIVGPVRGERDWQRDTAVELIQDLPDLRSGSNGYGRMPRHVGDERRDGSRLDGGHDGCQPADRRWAAGSRDPRGDRRDPVAVEDRRWVREQSSIRPVPGRAA